VVQASRASLGQLLSILLDNGVKYTDPGGRVTLRLTAPKGGVLLTVSNTPARMPEGDPDRLFDRFYRGDAARSQAAGGYGIGLSAARAIAETWQGTIEARAEGAQTMVFSVRF
ncbi:MAG: ATP-binding protein, partial [Clostridiales bacterium]|nr:ATP-binding protein [Clostridiales bacterium]